MKLTDEQWLAEARSRFASGKDWETPADEAPLAIPITPPPVVGTALRCPYCAEPSGLELFHRYEVASASPLLYCPRCYGFWAAGDAVARGVADATDEHPALFAHTAPARCRSCSGRLDANEVCRACGKKLPSLACPACGVTMARAKMRGVTIDSCAACKGVWFDVGELAEVFGLQPPQSAAMATVDEHATDGELPGWQAALSTVLGLFLQFV